MGNRVTPRCSDESLSAPGGGWFQEGPGKVIADLALCRWKSFYLLLFVFSPTWVQKRPSGICNIPFSLFLSARYVVRKGHFTPFVQTWTLYMTLANGTTEAISVLPTPSPSASQTALLRVLSAVRQRSEEKRMREEGRERGRDRETHTERFVV